LIVAGATVFALPERARARRRSRSCCRRSRRTPLDLAKEGTHKGVIEYLSGLPK
jgi:hypothetical protein